MLNRRLIRVKVFKLLFGKAMQGSDSLDQAEKELMLSCSKTVELYCFLLGLPAALKEVAQARIDAGKMKFRPTPQEANPNTKFVDNKFIGILENDTAFHALCKKKGLLWGEYDSFIKKLFASIITKEYYNAYMESPERSLKEDAEFIKKIYEEELEDNEVLEDILEEMSLYWMDDLAYTVNVILKNIPAIAKKGVVDVPQTFLKEDDREYAKKLLSRSILNYDEYTELVSSLVSNWDLERLVATDLALIVMGVTEAVTFESIPLKVTINEFVDISKYYSTPNSKVFVNGLLDRILQQMVKDGKIVKSGRGLVE
ncbi:MAG: transcription antitermination protein NusB [Bacteroidales bacterium]|nr:transcription antitermination protein NusB [Bacteroidales bacterium]